jgi:hypothetical protein
MRFTIRDLLWLTVVASLAVGWWVDHRSLAARDVEHERDARYLAEVLATPRLSENGTVVSHRLLVKYGWASPGPFEELPKD